MVQLVFYGTEGSKTDETQLRCFCNTRQEIFIGIEEKDSPEICISMSKETAIKFSKELRKQIAIISDERLD